MKTYTPHHKLNTELEFQNKFNREVVGIIFEIEISITEFQHNIIYHVRMEDGKEYKVDGELFSEM